MAFLIDREEAVELHHRAGRAQLQHARGDFGRNVGGRAFELGQFHLACDRAQPNELVEFGLVGIEEAFGLARPAGEVGRTDGFVRFLRVLGLGLVAARRRRHVFVAEIGLDHAAHRADRFARDLHAVGTHISNETDGLAVDVDTFIETLRHPHGVRGRKAELAACFLLQGRGGEGRLRMAFDRLRFDIGDAEGCGLQRLFEGFRLFAGADVEPLQLLAVGADKARFEGFVARRRQRRDQRPVFLADEFFDFELAVADKPQRDRLHPAGRARARKLAPQHRRQREADEIVERAPGEIGVDQSLVDPARMAHRLRHRLLGDGIENHPLDRLAGQRLLLLEHFQHVPGNRLAFAVGVGRQNELVGALGRLGDVVEALLGLGVDLPDHAEIVLGIDRAGLGG